MDTANLVVIRPQVARMLALMGSSLPAGVIVAVIAFLADHGVLRIVIPAIFVAYVVLAGGYLIGLRFHARVLIRGTRVRYSGPLFSRTVNLQGASVLQATIAYSNRPASYWCLIDSAGRVRLKLNQQSWDVAELDGAFCDGLGLSKRVEPSVDPASSSFPGLVPPGLRHFQHP